MSTRGSQKPLATRLLLCTHDPGPGKRGPVVYDVGSAHPTGSTRQPHVPKRRVWASTRVKSRLLLFVVHSFLQSLSEHLLSTHDVLGAAFVLRTQRSTNLSLPSGDSVQWTHTEPRPPRERCASFPGEARRAPWRRGRVELHLKHKQASTVGEVLQEGAAVPSMEATRPRFKARCGLWPAVSWRGH